MKGTKAKKEASMDLGVKKFPELEKPIRVQKDADCLLILAWKLRNLGIEIL